MNGLNSILIEGNLVHDPETKTTPNGSLVCTFSIESNRFYRKDEAMEKEVSYFDVEAWSRLGQACAENLKEGRGVRVVGRISNRKDSIAVDGNGTEYTPVYIVAEHVEFKPSFH